MISAIENQMIKPVVVGIGEILFDILGDTEELGGAPVNFAYHVNMLGATGYPVSTIGDDERGRRVLKELTRRDLSTDYITSVGGLPTGFVQVSIHDTGIATYLFPDNIAWDNLTVSKRGRELLKKSMPSASAVSPSGRNIRETIS